MSRKTDLEGHIRESYSLICEYEAIIRTSDRPKEKLRAKRVIREQRALIEGYLREYRPLAGGLMPADVAEIADHASGERVRATSSSGGTSVPADPSALRRRLAEAETNLRLIQERKAQYVMQVDVPLQLIKEERRLLDLIIELKEELERGV